jgi:transmembrane sensor
MSDTTDRCEDAATWVARMMRPDAARFDAEFRAWLAADATNEENYRRLEQHFAAAQILARSSIYGRVRPDISKVWWAGAVATGLAAAATMLFSLHRMNSETRRVMGDTPTLLAATSSEGDVRALRGASSGIDSVVLSDGTRVTLDHSARLQVSYDDRQRLVHLEEGRVRFEVAHGSRPFIVTAGRSAVVAVGTVFDVDVSAGGETNVTLLRGLVDVHAKGPTGAIGVYRLKPNESARFTSAAARPVRSKIGVSAGDWTSGLDEVDSIPLAALVSMANSRSDTKLELAQADLGAIRVSGRFRLDRPAELATNLADLFGLRVDATVPGRIRLEKSSPYPPGA